MNQDFHLVRSSLYFLNDFEIDQKALHFIGTINREGGERGQFTGENSACTIITNTKLSTKNVTEFLAVFDCAFYYFYIIQ